MHLAFFVLGGLFDDFLFGFYDFCFVLFFSLLLYIDILCFFTTINRIFFVRLRGLAIFFLYDLLFMSLSGVLSRALGIVWDLRLFCTYDIYFLFCADFFFVV